MAPHNDVEAFHNVLRSSRRILALCGAGLSASSGLPTFRGAGGLWRNHDATSLATPEAFEDDPGLVWLFYGYRRHMSLRAEPNPAHHALAALAKKNRHFLCLTQNVDNLSQRADHPHAQLRALHGSLFDIKCSNPSCTWVQGDNYRDPLFPAVAAASEDVEPGKPFPLLDAAQPLDPIPREAIPRCPQCDTGLQRPGVVWFGESLNAIMMMQITNWLYESSDLMLVIGTSAQVYPAAGFISKAKGRGARVVVINPDAENEDELQRISRGDFAFGQDAAEYLPLLLEPIIGKLETDLDPANTAAMQGFNMGRYVPPDVQGTTSGNRLHNKHPLGARASKPGSLTVRFELPFAVWCSTCPKPTVIGQGVRFNAAKRRVGSYFSTPIWSFRFRHADCGGDIEIRTDPQNTAYAVVEGGAKRDTGEDAPPREGDAAILTDQEREALRKNAFASLEKTIEDREQFKAATLRIDELIKASAKHWDDPYQQNQRLRKAFRQGRKERERDAAAAGHLQDRMSLGIELVPVAEEDARRAALVDFGSADDGDRDRALSKPLFHNESRKKSTDGQGGSKLKADKEASKRKETLVSEFMSNTRAAQDPFLMNTRHENKGPARLPGVKRKRPAQETESQVLEPPPKAQAQAQAMVPAGLVDYDSD
ncbi:hypothetical protein F66182_2336 [Fusarium sp. NRRL 66182]|nr:hypothetical protein F66182_2336 [Fusarium sp. NRRL 66182]